MAASTFKLTFSTVIVLVGVFMLLSHASASGNETYETCLRCFDVSSPSECRQSLICGEGEMCYAREFTDHYGLHSYHLGCEDKAICNIFSSAMFVLGKRDMSIYPRKCYECCSGYECNGRLCHDGGSFTMTDMSTNGKSSPTTTTRQATSTQSTQSTGSTSHRDGSTTPASWCLDPSVQFKNSCYTFTNWSATWDTASVYCKSHGGDLVSINSQDEQDFLVKQLNIFASVDVSQFWTGGMFSSTEQEWVWADNTSLHYTNWSPEYPGGRYNEAYAWITLSNPRHESRFRGGPWFPEKRTFPYPFICEEKGK